MNAMLLVSFVLTLIAVLLWRNLLNTKWASIVVSVLVFVSLVLCGIYFFINQLTGSGIDESVIYHLSYGMDGAGYEEFRIPIILALAFITTSAVASILIYKIVRTNATASRKRIRAAGTITTILLALFFNPATSDILELYYFSPDADNPPHALYIENETIDLPDDQNVVFLYLESLERTYFDETRFPGLVPNLSALEEHALSFTNIRELKGTGWTIAGMISSMCGIPLVTPNDGNSMSGMDKYLPGATCLGDLLDAAGYDLNYLGGARLDFAGKGIFYKTHGFDRVEGFDELNGVLEDPGYKTNWGLYDDTLYSLTAQRFDELSAREQPFGLAMLTLDTHHPNGYSAIPCADIVYQDGRNPILNAVHCADIMAAEFVDYIRKSAAFDDTILVVMSDHLAMQNTAWEQLHTGERRNLLMFFGEDIAPRLVSAPGSTLDTAPTLLNLMGAGIEGFGFGRDLLQEGKNLNDQDVQTGTILASNHAFLSSLWAFPQLDQGYRVDLENEQLFLSGRTVKLPVLLVLDEDLTVSEIRFEFYTSDDLINQLSELPSDQRFLWIDFCKTNAGLGGVAVPDQNKFCAVSGALEAEKLDVVILEDDHETGFAEIALVFEEMVFSQDIWMQRQEALARSRVFGWNDVQQFVAGEELEGHFGIMSAGFGAGRSQIINIDLDKSIRLDRGLTIVGFNVNASPVELGYLDTCAYNGAIEKATSIDTGFAEVIEQYSPNFGALAIIAHDSAVCHDYDLEPLFRGTELSRWDEIDFRTPYIGLITGNGEVFEYLGASETALSLEARNFVRATASVAQRQMDSLPIVGHAGGVSTAE